MCARESPIEREDQERLQDSDRSETGLLASILVLVSVGGFFLFKGWRRWSHVLVDFGREIYVPWRLSLGDVLYRDVAYFNGPLSPHLNALVFRVFGTHYMSLALFNIALLGITLWLVYRLLTSLADRLTATVGGVLFLVIFALADLTRAGNYNFVTPYSHEMTHGSLLGLATLMILIGYLRTPRRSRLFAAGLLLGLVFLTKAEFFLAAGATALAVLLIETRRDNHGLSHFIGRLGSVTGGFILPPLIAWLLLQLSLSPAAALRGVFGPWPYVFVAELGELIFYQKGMGTDVPGEHLRRMLVWLALYLALLVPPFLIALRTRPAASARRWLAVAAALWTGVLFGLVAPRFDLTDLPRPLPIVLMASLMISLTVQLGSGPQKHRTWRSAGILAFNVYALLLLAKMALHPRFHNYGFALAMPAMMFLVVLLLHELPGWIERRGGYGPTFRLSALIWLTLVAIVFAWPSILVYGEKNLRFGRGADMFRIQDRYVVMQRLLQRLPAVLEPNETLVVIPEGIMLNYQLRVENPTPHINFMPPELIMFGEDAILASLAESPPDVIVLVKRQTMEYGFESIGSGYGEKLMRWVTAHYPIIETVEDSALWGASFGRALILRGPVEQTSAPPDGGAQAE